MVLQAKSLKKAIIPDSLFHHPSPASLQSTRLALHVNAESSSCWVYIASGSRVYKLVISLDEDSLVDRGKESLLIPEQTQVLASASLNRCPHRSEIQSIVLAETQSGGSTLLGSVDSYGHLIVSELDGSGTDLDKLTYSVSPLDYGVGEGSWAGLCFNPNQWSTAAVARSFCKSIDLYEQDFHLRTLRTFNVIYVGRVSNVNFTNPRLWYPTSLIFVQNINASGSPVLAITEGSQLSIWDSRMQENGGCVHRICGSVGDMLYAVCSSSSGIIAAGGADRTVTVYDPRRWSALSRWLNCSKYEITGLAFSSVDPDYIYVQGVDYEVLCGQWKESNKAFSFRGDSNWLGFSKCSNRDVLAGWCDSGSLFVADIIRGYGT